MDRKSKLIGISGSLRTSSYCTAILNSATNLVGENATLVLLSLHGLPLYNQDFDGSAAPRVVQAFWQTIAAADGLVIVTPEYNYGMSGVLKNALDWASRPYGQSKLRGKPVLTISSSPATTGGVRAQAHLTETLLANASRILLRPQIVIGKVHEKVVDDCLIDPESLAFIAEGLSDLMREIKSAHTIAA